MPDELVIRHCAPTLASNKTGNLFSWAYESEEELCASLRSLNERLTGKGLRVVPLRRREGRALIYVYRPGRLAQDLSGAEAERLLRECGYDGGSANRRVVQLIGRLRVAAEFPHEIGLFLGYPPEDVDGFMHRRDEAKLTGCWKVYGDVEAAQRTFEEYRRCTEYCLKQMSRGTALEGLAAAV